MSRHIALYDAFTDIGSAERQQLVQFLSANAEGANVALANEAIDYSLKIKPSFGGFILVSWSNARINGALVINKTGMSGFSPEYLLTYAAVHPEASEAPEVLEALVQKAVNHTGGNLAYHLPVRHPALKVFQALGFKQECVELRFRSRKLEPSR